MSSVNYSLKHKKVPEIKPLGALPEFYVGGCKHQVLTWLLFYHNFCKKSI